MEKSTGKDMGGLGEGEEGKERGRKERER